MAEDSEAQVQIARLLGEARLRAAPRSEVQTAVDARFGQLVDGLLAEASASDDVVDRDSALAFIDDRLRFLQRMFSTDQHDRLRAALQERLASW